MFSETRSGQGRQRSGGIEGSAFSLKEHFGSRCATGQGAPEKHQKGVRKAPETERGGGGEFPRGEAGFGGRLKRALFRLRFLGEIFDLDPCR